ncbi:hypothetical protein IQ07DRAFT_386587 [Pyrenochaeta sp. DS3sAY3a]|nr:hypothetical protein IQ07DRAFT_386587 [Pyrenochaeta sp. DS3sAY3a]
MRKLRSRFGRCWAGAVPPVIGLAAADDVVDSSDRDRSWLRAITSGWARAPMAFAGALSRFELRSAASPPLRWPPAVNRSSDASQNQRPSSTCALTRFSPTMGARRPHLCPLHP